MSRTTLMICAAAAGVALAKGAALAPTVAASLYQYGYEMTLDGSGEAHGYNAPRITLKNTGNTRISGLSLTIGDVSRNFDAFVEPTVSEGLGFSLLTIDDVNHGLRSDVLGVAFTGFDLDATWSGLLDIDHDVYPLGWPGTIEDARQVLWLNGVNAELTVTFEDGFSLLGTLPDDFTANVLESLALTSTKQTRTRFANVGDQWVFGQDVRVEEQQDPEDPPMIPAPTAILAGLSMAAAALLKRR